MFNNINFNIGFQFQDHSKDRIEGVRRITAENVKQIIDAITEQPENALLQLLQHQTEIKNLKENNETASKIIDRFTQSLQQYREQVQADLIRRKDQQIKRMNNQITAAEHQTRIYRNEYTHLKKQIKYQQKMEQSKLLDQTFDLDEYDQESSEIHLKTEDQARQEFLVKFEEEQPQEKKKIIHIKRSNVFDSSDSEDNEITYKKIKKQ